MIPLRDLNPSSTTPFVNYGLIIANVAVFLFETSLGRTGLNELIAALGLIPARVIADIAHHRADVVTFLPIVSSMFLHGGWLHLLGNMLFLWIFGDNVEDQFGHFRYLVFYFLAGVGAASLQVYMNPASAMPMVGASGAIAGVLGAYILMFPTAKVVTLVPIFFFFQILDLPAYLFLGLWFLMQAVSGLFSLRIAADAGGVAWWAHVGGFATGAVLVVLLRRRRR